MTAESPPAAMVDADYVAKRLGISTSAVYQLSREGKLPFKAIRFGRIIRFRRSEVELLASGSHDQAAVAQ